MMGTSGRGLVPGGGAVTTKKGKNKDQYGRKFGKKHGEAMLEFTKNLWLQDAVTSLRNLLQVEGAQQAFMAFLKTEYAEAQLEFLLEAQKLEKMDAMSQGPAAQRVYQMFMNVGGKGIGQQERTEATQQMWDSVNQSSGPMVDPQVALARIRSEAETSLKMLAFDAFPRFVKSPMCQQALQAIRQAGGNAQVESMLASADSKVPQDADDWLNIFVATAESLPACIVISDMTIPGAPMVFVNNEFCKTTGYSKEEAVGRNCRFLQGPETEPEAIQVIRNTLSKGQDCHVKLTNYRKNGEMFQNLLSMRPVFDADGIYRYVIGVQFEIKDDSNLKERLIQLDKLLRLLPSKLNLRSKASARAKGAMAVKVTGEANQLINNKEQILQQSKQMEMQEQNQNRPKNMVGNPLETPMSQLNLDHTVAAFTKIIWLNCQNDVMQAISLDPLGREYFEKFVKTTSLAYQNHFEFVCKFIQVASAQGQDQIHLIRKFHMKRNKNCMFYCAQTEINYGTLNQMNWGPVFQEMQQKSQASVLMLANDLLPKFLNSKLGFALINKVRQRELQGQQGPLRTAAGGLDKNAESFWLDMFKVLSETVKIGMVISDMTVPGIPLVYINEGFRAVTGYGKEKIGCSCRFLQGKETEPYLNDEIMAALQHAEPLLVKLHNYKSNGQKFQCLLALHPVMGPSGEYKYQIGIQLDFLMGPEITRQLLEMERILRYMPHSITGEDAEDIIRLIPTDVMGDGTIFPLVNIDPSEVRSAALQQSAAAPGGFGGMGGLGSFAPPVVSAPAVTTVASGQGAEAMAQGKEVVTKKGKGKDQYGRTFGKKQKAAMLEFTKTLWLQDATTSLRNLLQMEVAQQAFLAFLKTEYGEAQLEFFLEAQKLERMDPAAQAQYALNIYQMFISTGGKGIGQQERTAATQQMWDYVNQSGNAGIDPQTAIQRIREEAETTLKMLAFDAFPRFVKSKYCQQVMAALQQGGNSQMETMLNQLGNKVPQDADDWLNIFVSTAESFPACIVISDMTIPGAPMVFVNHEFCRTTGYSKEEATGRNCRFLQGPDTEPEAIQVIRNTLSKGQDCHVKLTNYRKNGEKFQNLLSMKPVFDADGIYRYVIGVQFEIKEDSNLKERLIQLDKLLRLLPSKLNLRSKASARAKGAMAVKVTGEANQLINNKEQILQQSKQMEIQEMAQNQNRPKNIVSVSNYDPRTLNYDRTVAAFTKIMWLQDPISSCRAMLMDQMCREYFINFADGNCGLVVQTHLRFFDKVMSIRTAQGAQQLKKIRSLHMKRNKNELFYCATTEIEYGTLNSINWGPIFENVCLWQEQSAFMLAAEAFPRFLEHPTSVEMISKLKNRELAGEQLPCRTVAAGVNPNSETYWLDLFRNMSETISVGMVISDMTVPGIPLVYINEGFRAVTGYGKEKIGCSCRFLQGKETESYLNDEIMAALQQSEPLYVKLHNYKSNGQKFQCLFALHPVFGPAPDYEYKYQIGMQLDFNSADPDLHRKIAEMARVLRFLPQSVSGEKLLGVDRAIMELEALVGPPQQRGMGMGGGMSVGVPNAMGMMGMPSGGGGPSPMGMSAGGMGMSNAAPPMGGGGGFGMGGMAPAPSAGGMGAPVGGMGMGGMGGPAAGGMGMGGMNAPAPGGMGGMGAPAPMGGNMGMGGPASGMGMGAPAPGGMGMGGMGSPAPMGGNMGMGGPAPAMGMGGMGAPAQGGMGMGGMGAPAQGGMGMGGMGAAPMGGNMGMGGMGSPGGGMGISPAPPNGAPPSFGSPRTQGLMNNNGGGMGGFGGGAMGGGMW
eukprot:gene5280-5816_t